MHASRRNFLKTAALFAAATALPLPRLWAQSGGRFTALRRNVGIYTNSGGTIGWMVNRDATVVVDSQFPENAADCLKGLMERREAQVDALFNTHHHGDHTGGNAAINARKIVAHKGVPDLQRAAGNPRGEVVTATAVFENTWSENYGDERVTARHLFDAHTSADSIIHFEKANVAHMGDLVFNRVYPFIDQASGASVKGWIRTLETAAAEFDAETLYVFGHGQPSFGMTGSKADVLHFRDFLSALYASAERGVKAGRSKEEVTSMMTLPGFEDFVSFGPRLSLAANLGVAYDEAAGQ